jgi:hypothetical protein
VEIAAIRGRLELTRMPPGLDRKLWWWFMSTREERRRGLVFMQPGEVFVPDESPVRRAQGAHRARRMEMRGLIEELAQRRHDRSRNEPEPSGHPDHSVAETVDQLVLTLVEAPCAPPARRAALLAA